jgi:hypothetical protein
MPTLPRFIFAIGLAAFAAAFPAGAHAQTCEDPPSGLISWWPGQGNGADIIGGNDLTTGSAGFVAAKVGQGFDLSTGSMTGPGAPFDFASPGFTAEFWMKGVHDQPDAQFLILDKSHDSGGNDGWAFQGDSTTGELSFLSGNGIGFDVALSGIDVLDGAWHHIAGTWGGTSLRLYVDGTQVDTTPHALPVASPGGLEVGDWHSASRRYVGLIDEISIYDRRLMAGEIQDIIDADTAGKCLPCGNGSLNPGEQCDDGNNTDGDCCDSDCQYEAAGSPCADDSNVCTDDECNGSGTCTHGANTDPCDDDLFCNGDDTCSGGSCSSHAGDPCTGGAECADTCNEALDNCNDPSGTPCTDDSNECTDDECNGAGACAHPNNTDPCDDGLFCNGDDTCSGGSCSDHDGDPCAGGPECADNCNEALDTCNEPAGTPCADDGNPCRDDECNGSGACAHPANTDPCDDNVFCNGDDTCSGGSCSSHAGNPCTGGPECNDHCNESAENCFDAAGTACTDDGNPCRDDECNGSGACAHPANTDPCTDGLFCNGADTCSGGSCSTHAGDPCTGGTECNDHCNESTDNCFEAAGLACTPDASVCSDDECDGAGSCTHPAGNAGTPCRAAAGVCDVAESCNGSSPTCPADGKSTAQCRGVAHQCDAAEDCDGVNDDCPADLPIADGTSCDDAAACTIEDQCIAGECEGNSMTCGDGNIQAGCNEECDDGNLVADDGCDPACQLEPCGPTPDPLCRDTFVPGGGQIKITHADDPESGALQWKWSMGAATTRAEFGHPLTTDSFYVCVYDNDELVSTTLIPASGVCAGKACWKGKVSGFLYRDKDLTPQGAKSLKLGAGSNGKAKIGFDGAGPLFDMPQPVSLLGPVVIQLVKASDAAPCWTSTFSLPFEKIDATSMRDHSD